MNDKLIAIPSDVEIRNAIFAIHPDKAPGPDGFSASFFQSNWDSVGPAICHEIRSFFITGSLPHTINNTHIRLIPKISEPLKVSDYRPIALCNVYYKAISKLLAIRLKPVLQGTISEYQSAFVPDRAIFDNVLITHEVLHYLKTSDAEKHCTMAVKMDISKAYDRLEWPFIRQVLETLGFYNIWINWVLQCISTVSYAFLIDNEVLGEVVPQRGIRQGDPLSPYIFILCAEVLSGLCVKAQEDGLMVGVKVSHSPRLNHLLFADDTMIFTKSNKQSCSTLLHILRDYELASGQKINPDKSSISFSSKTPLVELQRVKAHLGISKEGGVGKYLGLPEHFGRKKKDLFASIVTRMKQTASGWSSRFLSTAGKMTMLQSVLSAIPAFAMSCFRLPVGLCNQIQSVLIRFWWDNSNGDKKICWLAWDKLTKPKSMGGLGFRDVQLFNQALLGKIAWRILTKPNCLLARNLKGKYCNNESFLSIKASKTSSHGWKGILWGRDLLINHLGKAIGDGSTTKVYKDSWIKPSQNLRPFGPTTQDEQDLFVADLLSRETREWNVAKIDKLLPNLAHLILQVKPSVLDATDSYVWSLQQSGQYTTKSGYFSMVQREAPTAPPAPQTVPLDWKKLVWSPRLSPKLKLFLWKILNEALPTGENLQKRGLLANTNCSLCGERETISHLFFQCRFAIDVWQQVPW